MRTPNIRLGTDYLKVDNAIISAATRVNQLNVAGGMILPWVLAALPMSKCECQIEISEKMTSTPKLIIVLREIIWNSSDGLMSIPGLTIEAEMGQTVNGLLPVSWVGRFTSVNGQVTVKANTTEDLLDAMSKHMLSASRHLMFAGESLLKVGK